jgi:hypothetical protein
VGVIFGAREEGAQNKIFRPDGRKLYSNIMHGAICILGPNKCVLSFIGNILLSIEDLGGPSLCR